jgi:hypothetical protein
MFLEKQEGVMYLNCENNKRLPFKSKFKEYTICDPLQVIEAVDTAEGMSDINTVVIDSLTYMLSMYQTLYVDGSPNGLKAWGEFSSFFKKLMQQHVAKSTKNIIFTAHTSDIMNETELALETLVKVPGSLMNFGIESFFSTVISTKKVALKQLVGYENGLLTITPEEEMLKYKYVFQTRLTKDTVHERMRGPIGMWDIKETYIDNNMQSVINRLKGYYN